MIFKVSLVMFFDATPNSLKLHISYFSKTYMPTYIKFNKNIFTNLRGLTNITAIKVNLNLTRTK